MTPEYVDALISRLRGSYRSLDGVVVVSPRLLDEAATELSFLMSQVYADDNL